jgi:hypothetical protein
MLLETKHSGDEKKIFHMCNLLLYSKAKILEKRLAHKLRLFRTKVEKLYSGHSDWPERFGD